MNITRTVALAFRSLSRNRGSRIQDLNGARHAALRLPG